MTAKVWDEIFVIDAAKERTGKSLAAFMDSRRIEPPVGEPIRRDAIQATRHVAAYLACGLEVPPTVVDWHQEAARRLGADRKKRRFWMGIVARSMCAHVPTHKSIDEAIRTAVPRMTIGVNKDGGWCVKDADGTVLMEKKVPIVRQTERQVKP